MSGEKESHNKKHHRDSGKRRSTRLLHSLTDVVLASKNNNNRTETSSGETTSTTTTFSAGGDDVSSPQSPFRHSDVSLSTAASNDTQLLQTFPSPPSERITVVAEQQQQQQQPSWQPGRVTPPDQTTSSERSRSRSNTMNAYAPLVDEIRKLSQQQTELQARVVLIQEQQTVLYRQHMALQRTQWPTAPQQQQQQQPTHRHESFCDGCKCSLW